MKRLNKVGSWNHLIVILGQPGTGKSTYAVKRIKQLGRDGPAYMLAHDPGWRLPDDATLERHADVGSAAIGLAKAPGNIHALTVADGDSVVAFATQCAKASIDRGQGNPVAVLIDEGVATKGISPHRLSPQMAEFVATRRWLNTGMIVTAQSPLLVHYQMLGLSTEIVMFRLIDERGLRRLETIGVPPNILSSVRKLPNYHSITHKTG